VEAHERGVPVMRAMPLMFPMTRPATRSTASTCWAPSLLVAPVFSPDGVVDYYLPNIQSGRGRSRLGNFTSRSFDLCCSASVRV
jgi:alpha-glucosidase (family GH31 glycosyl hydrolase)